MPIVLSNPISGPVVTRKELTAFAVDLQGGLLSLTFADLTDGGQRVGQSSVACALHAPDGSPLFTGAEYASIKAAVYRIAIASGAVDGSVV